VPYMSAVKHSKQAYFGTAIERLPNMSLPKACIEQAPLALSPFCVVHNFPLLCCTLSSPFVLQVERATQKGGKWATQKG
jgi:hypothetical protein